jgi:DNA primase
VPARDTRLLMSVTDEIKERLDIVDVVSRYVPLKKAGRNYKGLCPFHGEKTPSFIVFPDSQNWHCFGACGTGGDIFAFMMKRENLDFGEALKLLAAQAGVELQPRGEQGSAEDRRLERLREIVAEAAIYFHYLLNRAGEAQIARDTLERRGLVRETWEGWQLGYAFDSWDALKDRLAAKGYALEEIEAAGLVIGREDGSGYYDRFRGRLMIPIRDVQGRTIGFGGRVLREDPERPQPKYINSPQTPLFDKGGVLYGLDMARKAIRDADLAVLVEGYMDVLMSHQVGVRNVVAGMGTALTDVQLRQLKRYTGNITLALDPDTAGDAATLRGLETARQSLEREWEPVLSPTGLVRQESRLKAQLRIATLPKGQDPDKLARNDPEGWLRVISEAKPLVDYYLAVVSSEENLATARGKANAVARMAPLIREIANPVERSHYVQLLARMVQTDERLVAEQVATTGREKDRKATGERAAGVAKARARGEGGSQDAAEVQGMPAIFGLEEHILGCLLSRPDLMGQLDAEMIEQKAPPLCYDDFATAESRAILIALQVAPSVEDAEGDQDLLPPGIPDVLLERCRAVIEQARRNPTLTDEKLLKDLGDSLLRLRARNLYEQISQLEYLILESEQTGAREQLRQYQELMVSYSAQKRQIQKLLNARSMLGALEQQGSSQNPISLAR